MERLPTGRHVAGSSGGNRARVRSHRVRSHRAWSRVAMLAGGSDARQPGAAGRCRQRGGAANPPGLNALLAKASQAVRPDRQPQRAVRRAQDPAARRPRPRPRSPARPPRGTQSSSWPARPRSASWPRRAT